jgi:two-component sensor histidine kinase
MDQAAEISSSDRAFSEARLLLREYSHRINNEFAAAISFVSIAAARSSNEQTKAVLTAVETQLLSYAHVHHVLQMPEHGTRIDASVYLRQLCRAISCSKLNDKGIELLFVERSFQMDSERCWRLGLIVSELITNAARHAFRESGGTIRVELMPTTSFVECWVIDNGVAAPNVRPGLGLRIMRALSSSLGATIDQQFGSSGTATVLIVPLAA